MVNFNFPVRKTFENFEGSNLQAMPKLLADNRVPINFASFMLNRLYAVASKDQGFIEEYWLNFADTGDGIVMRPDGKHKISLDSSMLRSLNPKSELSSNGQLVIADAVADEYYNTVLKDTLEFTSKDAKKYTGKPLSLKEAIDSPYWGTLGRSIDEKGVLIPEELAKGLVDAKVLRASDLNDRRLHAVYAKVAFKLGKEHGYETMMGTYLPDKQSRTIEGLWCARRLYGYSDAVGNGILDYDSGRLVGVAPEAPGAQNLVLPKTTLDYEVMKAHETMTAYQRNGILWVPTTAPNIDLKK
jgi:hypothetical protein